MSSVCRLCLGEAGIHHGSCPEAEIDRLNQENLGLRRDLEDQRKIWTNLRITELRGQLEKTQKELDELKAKRVWINKPIYGRMLGVYRTYIEDTNTEIPPELLIIELMAAQLLSDIAAQYRNGEREVPGDA